MYISIYYVVDMLLFAFSDILPPSQRNGSVGRRHSVVHYTTTQRKRVSTLLGVPQIVVTGILNVRLKS